MTRAPQGDAPASEHPVGGAGLVAGLAELTLETTDLEALTGFYRDIVGLRVLDRQDDRVWLALGDSTRLGVWSPGRKEYGDEGGRHVHFALSAAPQSLDRLTGRLREAEIEVEGPVEHPGGDRSIYFRDPSGNLVEAWDFFERGDGASEGVEAL